MVPTELWIGIAIVCSIAFVLAILAKTSRNWNSGWEEVTALSTLGLVAITATGFLFLSRQLRDGQESLRNQTFALENQTRWQIYQLSFSLYKLIVDSPTLYPFFYEGKELPKECGPDGDHDRYRVLAAAELLLDYFEAILLSGETLDATTRGVWNSYMKEIYATSPAVRYLLTQKPGRFTKDLIEEFRQ